MSALDIVEYLDSIPFYKQTSAIYNLHISSNDQLYESFKQCDDFRARYVCLQICSIRRDVKQAMMMAREDRSAKIRRGAYYILSRYGEPDEIRSMFHSVPYLARMDLVKRLKKRKRPIDDLLMELKGKSIIEFRQLFYFGSSKFIEEFVDPEHDEWLAGWQWRKFGKHHPQLALKRFRAMVDKVNGPHPFFEKCSSALIQAASKDDIESAFMLLNSLTNVLPSDKLPTTACSNLNGIRFLDWLRNRSEIQMDKIVLSPKFFRRKNYQHLLPDSVAADIRLTHLQEWKKATNWIAEKSLDLMIPEFSRSPFVVGAPFLAKCCLERRKPFVDYALSTLSTGKEHINRYYEYVSLNDWETGSTWLKTRITNALDVHQATGPVKSLAAMLRHHPDQILETLCYFVDISRELKDIGSRLVEALKSLPPRLLSSEMISILISMSEVDANKYGWQWSQLWMHLLPAHPKVMLEQIMKRGCYFFNDMSSKPSYIMTEENARVTFKYVRDKVMQAQKEWNANSRWEQTGNIQLIMTLTRPYLFKYPDELLKPLMQFDGFWKEPAYSESLVLTFIARINPRAFADIMVTYVRDDLTWMKFDTVAHLIIRYYPEVLDKYFDGGFQMKGPRNVSGQLIVLKCANASKYLSYKQMRRLSDLFLSSDMPKDETNPYASVQISAITELVSFPITSGEVLHHFIRAHRADKQTWMQRAAYSQFCRMDDSDGLRIAVQLVTEGADQEGIHAIYHAILALPEEEGIRIVLDLVTKRVGVAKEGIRLLGAIRSSRARSLLFELLNRKDPKPLHHHVRVAVIRGLWNYLYDETTWNFFDMVVHDEDFKIARKIAYISQRDLGPAPHKRLMNLIATALQRSEQHCTRGVLRRLCHWPVTDYQGVLLSPLLDTFINLIDTDLGQQAFQSILSIAQTARLPDNQDAIHVIVERLMKSEGGVDQLQAYLNALKWSSLTPEKKKLFVNLIIDKVTSLDTLTTLVMMSEDVSDFFQRVELLRARNELAFMKLAIVPSTNRYHRLPADFVDSAIAKNDELYALMAFNHFKVQLTADSNSAPVKEILKRFEDLTHFPLLIRAVTSFSVQVSQVRKAGGNKPQLTKTSLRHGLPGVRLWTSTSRKRRTLPSRSQFVL